MRIRPVLMTALAMIIGMAPMALGLGEGGEQNAPLGGGLKIAPYFIESIRLEASASGFITTFCA